MNETLAAKEFLPWTAPYKCYQVKVSLPERLLIPEQYQRSKLAVIFK